MKTRFSICLAAALIFGFAFLRFAVDLRPFLFPESLGYGASAPEGIVFLLPTVLTFGCLAAASLYGTWFYRRALRGRPPSRRGRAAFFEGLALLSLSAGLAGSSVILLVLFFGHGVFTEGWWKIIPYAISTPVGVGAFFSLYFAAKAFAEMNDKNSKRVGSRR